MHFFVSASFTCLGFANMLLGVSENLKIVLRLEWRPILLIFSENSFQYDNMNVIVVIVSTDWFLHRFLPWRILLMIFSGYRFRRRSVLILLSPESHLQMAKSPVWSVYYHIQKWHKTMAFHLHYELYDKSEVWLMVVAKWPSRSSALVSP